MVKGPDPATGDTILPSLPVSATLADWRNNHETVPVNDADAWATKTILPGERFNVVKQ